MVLLSRSKREAVKELCFIGPHFGGWYKVCVNFGCRDLVLGASQAQCTVFKPKVGDIHVHHCPDLGWTTYTMCSSAWRETN